MIRDRDFFLPHEFKILRGALARAEHVLSATGCKGRAQYMTEVLARGVVLAARRGRMDAVRLSDRACSYWIRETTALQPQSVRVH